MTYKVRLTDDADAQFYKAVQYISKELSAPSTARRWAERMKKEMAGLATMPRRYPLVEELPLQREEVRKMVVENFIVYYWIAEEVSTVWVIGIVYGRRDQLSALSHLLK